jgi:hypothetical protein
MFDSVAVASRAMAMPIAAATKANRMLSASSCPIRCRLLAPSAARTAISRDRTNERASIRFATFAHAMRSTNETAPIIMYSVERTLPMRLSCNGTITKVRLLFVFGYVDASWLAKADSRLSATSSETPRASFATIR